jgi:hypothetical protein
VCVCVCVCKISINNFTVNPCYATHFIQRHLKAAGPQYVLNGIVKHCLEQALNFLTKLLTAVSRMQCVRPAWKQPRVIPAGTGGQKDLSSYRFLNLLDTIGKESPFMLTRSVSDLCSHGSLRHKQVEFRLTAGRQKAWTVSLQGLIETLKSSC